MTTLLPYKSPPKPTHGYTKHGHAVHAKTTDHLPAETPYQRFNKAAAVLITAKVGSMTTTWVFCLLALLSLPAVLSGFGVFAGVFPAFIIKTSVIALVAWVAQTFIQLVLLPAIMVGQNIQSLAADARATKTFEDVEKVLDALDTKTQGGITEVLDAIKATGATKVNTRARATTAAKAAKTVKKPVKMAAK